jgi:hypothetical protein
VEAFAGADRALAAVSDGGQERHHSRQVFLKISAAMLDAFTAIRECCVRVMRKDGAIPETS